jgi:hypothetical protein
MYRRSLTTAGILAPRLDRRAGPDTGHPDDSPAGGRRRALPREQGKQHASSLTGVEGKPARPRCPLAERAMASRSRSQRAMSLLTSRSAVPDERQCPARSDEPCMLARSSLHLAATESPKISPHSVKSRLEVNIITLCSCGRCVGAPPCLQAASIRCCTAARVAAWTCACAVRASRFGYDASSGPSTMRSARADA